jgi:hypothetical protein
MTELTFLGVFVGIFATASGDEPAPADRRSTVFLEEPQSTAVGEAATAVFRCSVVNSSLHIFWLVDSRDAGYAEFEARDISIHPDPSDDTRSRLVVVGHLFNSGTPVQCAAWQEHRDPRLRWIPSAVALLTVLEEAVEESETVVQPSSVGATSPPLSLAPTTVLPSGTGRMSIVSTPTSSTSPLHLPLPDPERNYYHCGYRSCCGVCGTTCCGHTGDLPDSDF